MADKVTVYTAIIDGYDKLEPPEKVCGGCEYIALSDKKILCPPWKCIVVKAAYKPRLEARYWKILFDHPNEISLWVDGQTRLKGDTAKWVKSSLKGYDIALRKHPVRDCVYDEAEHCIDERCDDEATIMKQMERYDQEGYPEKRGLSWTGAVMRRNDGKVRRFNEMWWDEVRDYSIRDQLSFDRCAWKMKMRVKHLAVDDKHVAEVGHVKHTRRVE